MLLPSTHNTQTRIQTTTQNGSTAQGLHTHTRKDDCEQLCADRQVDALGRHENAVLEQQKAAGVAHRRGQRDGAGADGHVDGGADARTRATNSWNTEPARAKKRDRAEGRTQLKGKREASRQAGWLDGRGVWVDTLPRSSWWSSTGTQSGPGSAPAAQGACPR